jgi:phthiodiolone/phenolphthiodiolone dimycocerosates ketoreductase
MRDIKYGLNPVEFPPIAAHRAGVQAYDQAGLDFLTYWDQHCLTIPRSLWTPDICPAAEMFHIDAWLEPWPLLTDAAIHTDNIRLGLSASDVTRRTPDVLAQLALTLDHYSEGRFFLALGAGEVKQCTPYGIARDKPFGRLEETLKLLKLWFNTDEPIDYDGTFYKVKAGGISTPAFTEGGPPLLVAGGPGKAMRYAAQLADGWVSYFPGSDAQSYADEVGEFNRLAEDVGKNGDDMTKLMLFAVVLGDTEEDVAEMLKNPVIRWDSAALVPGGYTWKKHGLINPLGEDFSYPRDLYPMEWTREDAMKIVDQITPDMVRHFKFCGTPEQVAHMIQPFVEAGANHVMLGDYGSLVMAGDMGSAVDGSRRLAECFDHLRRLNGQPTKLPQLAVAGDLARQGM